MAEREGRRYWEIMNRDDSSFMLRELPASSACPFRHGLYQIMRNRVLADCLRREKSAEWADVAVCIHPDNEAVLEQPEHVSGAPTVVEDFQTITSAQGLREWNPREVLDAIVAGGAPVGWIDWMKRRYLL
jgi:hypothetical protein